MKRKISTIKNWQSIINAESKLCSAKTLKNAWGLVSAVLVMCGFDMPKVKLPQVLKAEKEYLDFEEIPLFCQAIKGHPAEIPALLALHSLLRSEIYALTRNDIDLEKGLIYVRGALDKDEHNVFVKKKENKTSSSRRTIPILIPQLTEAIKNNDGELMPIKISSISKSIERLCIANDLPPVTCHGLRHSFASLCYHLQIPIMETMALGGWSDYSTMQRIYTHLADQDKLTATQKLKQYYT